MIITKECIRHDGKDYAVNAKIEDINEKDAERLVDLGVAFYPETVFVQPPADDDDEKGKQQDPNTDDGKEKIDDGDPLILTPEQAAAELEKLFNYNGLKTVAKIVGLEFAGNISKANLISLILEQNKAEEVFDLVEEEEE